MAGDAEFRWDEYIHGRAFIQLKQMLVEAPILSFYDVTQPVVIQCDASSSGLGAYLSQNGRPIDYASRTMTTTERESYAEIEKETLAVSFALQRFDTYIYAKHCTVETDHKALVSIVRKPLSSAPKRLQRMLLRLQRYNFTVIYRPGSQMFVSDTLNRAYTKFPDEIATFANEDQRDALKLVASPLTIELLRTAPAADDQYQLLRRQIAIAWPASP